jgi:hypothetical protein
MPPIPLNPNLSLPLTDDDKLNAAKKLLLPPPLREKPLFLQMPHLFLQAMPLRTPPTLSDGTFPPFSPSRNPD